LSFQLKKVTSNATVINVTNDPDKTAAKVEEMVTAFNEVITYSRDNSAIEVENQDGQTVNSYGSLARTRVDEDVIGAIRTALASASSGISGSTVQIFADLGIKTRQDGTLEFKASDFSNAINNDPAAVENLLQKFADDVGATTGVIQTYTKFNGQFDLAQQSNDAEIKALNEQLERIDRSITALEERLRRSFTALEERVGQLQSQGSALSNILAGLG
ncbi:MAG: flagellar filament capping protein FliD, partial [Bdellovibrionales bacterium]|nr:flagellar filament capping protein FliD [Bdellovibrionales bacterium]